MRPGNNDGKDLLATPQNPAARAFRRAAGAPNQARRLIEVGKTFASTALLGSAPSPKLRAMLPRSLTAGFIPRFPKKAPGPSWRATGTGTCPTHRAEGCVTTEANLIKN